MLDVLPRNSASTSSYDENPTEMSEEFYTRPIFCVQDVAASIQFYCEKLGFDRSWGDELFAQVERDGLEIMLSAKSLQSDPARRSILSMSLRNPDNLVALHDEFCATGAVVGSSPVEVEWQDGTFELKVEDLDGNVLLFWGSMGSKRSSASSRAERCTQPLTRR